MRHRIIICILVLIIFCLSGCTSILSNADLAYEITTIEDDDTYVGEVRFPELVSASTDYGAVNQLIKETVHEQLEQLLAEGATDVSIQLDYSISISTNELLCILYEGMLSGETSAHATNFAFSVIISPAAKASVDPMTIFKPDAQWMLSFREQLLTNQNPERFSDEQWELVAEYIGSHTDEEIEEILARDLSKTIAFREDGVVVLFPTAHALGDYVKIFVPYT